MKIIWGKAKRHKPNPQKVRMNKIKRGVIKFWRNFILVLIFGGALVIILLY